MEAFQYDVRRGTHSVGAHVRDSACCVLYICSSVHQIFSNHLSRSSVAGVVLNMSHEQLPERLVADILHILPKTQGKRLYREIGGETGRI
mmetsp:Transcript_6091/g.23074  ORF Transcript_6091/g.23074 Transcript_6091/m.23074 type:complete len:90 (-) Transcript_6091:7-276(-)